MSTYSSKDWLVVIPFLRKRSDRFKGIDLMTLIPCKLVEQEKSSDSDQIVLLLPRFSSGFMSRLIQPRLSAKKKFIRVPLEVRGQWLWKNMDGVRTIGEMVPGFAEHFPDDKDQVPMRLAAFLYRMEENGFIEFT